MIERTYVSRNTFVVAGLAAVLTFLALVWVGSLRDRVHVRDSGAGVAPPEKRKPSTSQVRQAPVKTVPRPVLPVLDRWTPAPAEFVKLISPVAVYNARGKMVKQFPVGKRLRVSKRAGDKIVINYLGDEYTIATAATTPSK